MKMTVVKPSEEIVTFRRSLGQEVSVRELEATIDNLDLADIDSTVRAVKRCNNRCKGNKIAVAVEAEGASQPLTFAVRLTD